MSAPTSMVTYQALQAIMQHGEELMGQITQVRNQINNAYEAAQPHFQGQTGQMAGQVVMTGNDQLDNASNFIMGALNDTNQGMINTGNNDDQGRSLLNQAHALLINATTSGH